ncbi:hypothetical protein Tco_1462670 [Tanacetum coccineum]
MVVTMERWCSDEGGGGGDVVVMVFVAWSGDEGGGAVMMLWRRVAVGMAAVGWWWWRHGCGDVGVEVVDRGRSGPVERVFVVGCGGWPTAAVSQNPVTVPKLGRRGGGDMCVARMETMVRVALAVVAWWLVTR